MARKKKIEVFPESDELEPFEPIIEELEPFQPIIDELLYPDPIELPADVEIENPLKDFHICLNEIDIKIKKGVPVTIPRFLLQNMVTEKIIKKFPT